MGEDAFARPISGPTSLGELSPQDQPVDWIEDLGQTLLDIDYEPGGDGRGTPKFFDARVERGVLHIPPDLYSLLRWCHASRAPA